MDCLAILYAEGFYVSILKILIYKQLNRKIQSLKQKPFNLFTLNIILC